jgi:hypothetical protein
MDRCLFALLLVMKRGLLCPGNTVLSENSHNFSALGSMSVHVLPDCEGQVGKKYPAPWYFLLFAGTIAQVG